MPLSSYYRDVVLDSILSGSTYASIHSADPGLTGTDEITGGSYARKAITWSAAAAGKKASSADLTWTNMPAVSSISYIGLWDAASGGDFLGSIPMSLNKSTSTGDTFTINSGDLVAIVL